MLIDFKQAVDYDFSADTLFQDTRALIDNRYGSLYDPSCSDYIRNIMTATNNLHYPFMDQVEQINLIYRQFNEAEREHHLSATIDDETYEMISNCAAVAATMYVSLNKDRKFQEGDPDYEALSFLFKRAGLLKDVLEPYMIEHTLEPAEEIKPKKSAVEDLLEYANSIDIEKILSEDVNELVEERKTGKREDIYFNENTPDEPPVKLSKDASKNDHDHPIDESQREEMRKESESFPKEALRKPEKDIERFKKEEEMHDDESEDYDYESYYEEFDYEPVEEYYDETKRNDVYDPLDPEQTPPKLGEIMKPHVDLKNEIYSINSPETKAATKLFNMDKGSAKKRSDIVEELLENQKHIDSDYRDIDGAFEASKYNELTLNNVLVCAGREIGFNLQKNIEELSDLKTAIYKNGNPAFIEIFDSNAENMAKVILNKCANKMLKDPSNKSLGHIKEDAEALLKDVQTPKNDNDHIKEH